jgi:hypothetical protein
MLKSHIALSLRPLRILLLSLGLLGSPANGEVKSPIPAEIRTKFGLDPFYQKVRLVEGFPIVGSAKVADAALEEAAYLMEQMLGGRHDLLTALAENKVRFTIMARTEFTTDVPEHKTLRPKRYWDRRARGLGATQERPAVSCGEENLIGIPGDPYAKENILIHEFAHAIEGMGLSKVDPTFFPRLKKTFDAAMQAGLWKGKYAASNPMEYWAEAVQSWFDTNREDDHDHNHVNTRAELREYDPGVAQLVEEVFGDKAWRYQKPSARPQGTPLPSVTPAKEVPFTWPTGLWNERDLLETSKALDGLTDAKPTVLQAGAKPTASGKRGPASCLVLVNKTTERFSVYWVDEKGELQPRGEVGPGRLDFHDTSEGHVFALEDEKGKLRYEINATSGDSRILLLP